MILAEQGMQDDRARKTFLLEVENMCIVFMNMYREGDFARLAGKDECLVHGHESFCHQNACFTNC